MQRLLSFLLVLSFTFQLSAHRITIEVNTTDALLAAYKLILITTDGGDHIWGDHTVWGEARLVIE